MHDWNQKHVIRGDCDAVLHEHFHWRREIDWDRNTSQSDDYDRNTGTDRELRSGEAKEAVTAIFA